MDFFIGAITTLICVITLNSFIKKIDEKTSHFKYVKDTQAHRFALVRPAMSVMQMLEPPKLLDTQATRFFDSRHTTFALVDDKAYWIENNALFVTDIIDGNFEKESAKIVDTMAMDKLELNKIIYIVEQLTEGKQDDSGNTGESEL